MKERLVGAAVLVALGVWLIPLVLDGPRIGPADDSDVLELPGTSDPAPRTTRTIRLDDPAAEAVPAEPVQPAADAAVSTAPAPAADASAPEVRRPAEPERSTGPSIAQTQAPVADSPSPAAATRDESAAPTRAPQTGASASAQPEAAAAGDWLVQLGSFGEADNARRLAERVDAFGYQAQISTHRAGGRTLHRVRVGPYQTRERADAIVSSLAAHGFVAQVVVADSP